MNVKIKSQFGATTLIAAITTAAVILSISLSIMVISMNNKASMISFEDSMKTFYAAEAGVGESLMQLRRQPAELIFDNRSIGGINISSEFVVEAGECEPIPECQFLPGSGWWAEYFNHSVSHPDMEVNPYPGPTPTPTEHDWFDDTYKTHEQIDADLLFPTSGWYPYDGTAWEDREGYAHDYHFTQHWRARVTTEVAGNYGYALASDDDSWILLGQVVVVNNSGTHAAFTKTGDIFLAEGDNLVELYFAERHTVESGFRFSFDDPTLIITPWPEGCGDETECNSNIQATASTTEATRKVRYTCTQEISNCAWSELVP